jgi:hypothetical protein
MAIIFRCLHTQWAKAAAVMTPADQAIQEPEAPFSIRRRQRGGRRVVAVSSSVSAMDALRARIRAQSKTVADHIAADPEAQGFIDDWTTPLSWLAGAPGRRLCRPRPSAKCPPPPPFRQPEAPLRWPQLMTVNPETLEKLGRFLLRGLRIGASSATPAAGQSPARLWCAPANRRRGAH